MTQIKGKKTKKGAGKGARKGSAKRLTIKQRAEAIVADAEAYDQDTRDYTEYVMEQEPQNLAAWVERVERGERHVYPRWQLVGTPEPERGTREWRAWKTQHLCAAVESGKFGTDEPGAEAIDEFNFILDQAEQRTAGRAIHPAQMLHLLPTLLEIIDEQEDGHQQEAAQRAPVTGAATDHAIKSLTTDEVRNLTRDLINAMHSKSGDVAKLFLLCSVLATREDGDDLLCLGVEEACAMYMPHYDSRGDIRAAIKELRGLSPATGKPK